MWELSISVDSRKIDAVKFLYQNIKSKTKDCETVVACYEEFGFVFVLVGCPEEQKDRVCLIVENCIVSCICEIYKETFLSQKLQIPIKDNIRQIALRNALATFDKESDVFLVKKYLKFDKNLHLDSFFSFKLKQLQQKWDELILLANENKDYLLNNDSFFDLLKFLIDNLQISDEEINVFEEGNCFLLVEPQKEENKKLTKEELVGVLIKICPRRINLFCDVDNQTVGFLSKIFEERVNICGTGCIEKIQNFSALK